MSKPSNLFVVALLALSVACGLYLRNPALAQEKEKPNGKGFAAPIAAAPVMKWEYRIVERDSSNSETSEKELNQLGGEGFEIAFVTGSHRGGFRQETSPVIIYTLKRAK